MCTVHSHKELHWCLLLISEASYIAFFHFSKRDWTYAKRIIYFYLLMIIHVPRAYWIFRRKSNQFQLGVIHNSLRFVRLTSILSTDSQHNYSFILFNGPEVSLFIRFCFRKKYTPSSFFKILQHHKFWSYKLNIDAIKFNRNKTNYGSTLNLLFLQDFVIILSTVENPFMNVFSITLRFSIDTWTGKIAYPCIHDFCTDKSCVDSLCKEM